jgi:hypothetical protein
MSYTNILIPLVVGILLVASPQMFTKSTGDALDRAKGKLRKMGYILMGVAGMYFLVKVCESLAQPGTAVKPQMEMHRLQATTPGDSGWYLAESTHGSFSVLMPIPFNDFTLTANDPKLGMIRTYAVGALSAEGLKFSAIETPFVPGMNRQNLDQMQLEFANGGNVVSEVDKSPFSGLPSLSLSQVGPRSGAFVRYVLTETSFIMVILEYPVERRSDAVQLKSRFLDSLKVKTGKGP